MITEKQKNSIVKSLLKEDSIKEFFSFGNSVEKKEKPKTALRPNLKDELYDILTFQLGIKDTKLAMQALKACNLKRANQFVETIKGCFGAK